MDAKADLSLRLELCHFVFLYSSCRGSYVIKDKCEGRALVKLCYVRQFILLTILRPSSSVVRFCEALWLQATGCWLLGFIKELAIAWILCGRLHA